MIALFRACTLLILFASSAHAAAPHFWSDRFGNASTDQDGNGIAVDDDGNVFVVGDFLSTINFGGANLTSAGAGDIFVASFDADGDHRWSKRFGDTNPNQMANAVATDASGNVIVAGNHWGTVNFGGSPLTSVGGDDIFLVKFDNDGDHAWSKRFGDASSNQIGRAVAVSSAGEIYLAGSFTGTVDFGVGPHASVGGLDVYIAKFAANGTAIWSESFGGLGDQVLESIAVDASGHVALCGYFGGTVDFGGGQLVSAANNDIFLAKLDDDGDHVWSKRFGSGNNQEGAAVAIDDAGAVIAAGRFESTVNFGGSTLTSSGGFDVFVAKFTGAGAHVWSQRFGTTGDQGATALAADPHGIVAIGSFASTIDFGGGTLTNNGSLDLFVVRFQPDGVHLWSEAFGGTSDQLGASVAIDGDAKIALTGSFFSTIDFGGDNLTSGGGTDVFVAQLGDEVPNPVFITAFDAVVRATAIEVRWQLWSDEPLDGFTLYRSEGRESTFDVAAVGSAGHGTNAVIDSDVHAGSTYRYVLVVHTSGGHDIQSQEVAVTLPMATARLAQNSPNPFSGATRIEVTLDEAGPVRIGVYDVSGRRVRVLDAGVRGPGTHGVSWDGRDAAGVEVTSGVYFYRIEGNVLVAPRRMLLVR